MKANVMLVVTSLLSMLLLTLHVTDGIVRVISKAQPSKHRAARPHGLPIRDTRGRRTTIGTRYHAARRIVRGGHARDPYEGGSLRRDRQVHRRLLLRLDTLGARRAWRCHLHPRGARTVESATGSARVVEQPERGKARRTAQLSERRGLGSAGDRRAGSIQGKVRADNSMKVP
jgi:hypothetical protein